MRSNLDEWDKISARARLARLVANTPVQHVDHDDDEHRPLIERSIAPIATDSAHSLEHVRAEVQTFLNESQIGEEELSERTRAIVRDVKLERRVAAAQTHALKYSLYRHQLQTPRIRREAPQTRVLYAARTARREELDQLLRQAHRQANQGGHAAIVLSALARFETLSALIIERIDLNNGAQPIGLATIHRTNARDGAARFFSTPLWTAFSLTSEVYACGVSHVVHLAAEEVAKTCAVGRLTYVAGAGAKTYKSIVQATTRCRFYQSNKFAAQDDIGVWLGDLSLDHQPDRWSSDFGHFWPPQLFPDMPQSLILPNHAFEVATARVTRVYDCKPDDWLRVSLADRMRAVLQAFAAWSKSARSRKKNVLTRAPDIELIDKAITEDPRRRVFAGGDGNQLFWSSASGVIVAAEHANLLRGDARRVGEVTQ